MSREDMRKDAVAFLGSEGIDDVNGDMADRLVLAVARLYAKASSGPGFIEDPSRSDKELLVDGVWYARNIVLRSTNAARLREHQLNVALHGLGDQPCV